ncbi:MAG TPA: sigma-70 family RNA polymerase sigma factor [Acidimicrobiia bacterium]|jgi:RNA polymerase sigma factor (sigma-70 family)|nr:sigma-70 family RNA polymerase sigma factor [Acidimicrobiia bacterium]
MSDTLSFINLTDASLVSEEELLDRAREGDRSAFGTLYLRHRDAARKVAGMCASSAADAEDAVAEGFARVFAALPRMAGRQIAFRPYLLTCVRNAATDRLRRERRIDLRDQMPETPGTAQADDMALLGLERNLVGEALQALPARWRTVLWLTEVEGLSPAEVSRRIGIKPNAVAALAYRARKGLREAYLQAHLKAEASEDCRATVSRLGNYVRGDLAEKERQAVQTHLDACAKCRCRRDELTDVNATLRNAFLPVPLLLAGLQRKALNFGHMAGPLVDRAPDLSQTAALADNPLIHKALAGLSMLVLALSGTAVPSVMHQAEQPAQMAQADTSAIVSAVDRAVGAAAAPLAESRPATPAQAEAGAAPAGTAASAPTDDAAYRDVQGGSRSTLFGSSGNDGASNRPGGSRQTIIHRPDDAEEGGLLAGTPVGGAVDSVLSQVSQAVPLPVEATVSIPGVTGPFDAPLSATAQLPEGQSVAVQVPPALSGVLGGLLQPVTGALNGLTAGH